jgi:hypothetical protein
MDPEEWEGEDDSENEDRESHDPIGGRDGLIFLIDATEPMFSEDESGKSHFEMSLEV